MITRNGVEYIDSKELDEIMYDYIRETANELNLEFGKSKMNLKY